MDLALLADGSVTGSFYNSTIEAGRWKRDRGRLCARLPAPPTASARTTPRCAVGDHAEGQTWAEHRRFLFNWGATRADHGALTEPR